jgi:hypothetical protein
MNITDILGCTIPTDKCYILDMSDFPYVNKWLKNKNAKEKNSYYLGKYNLGSMKCHLVDRKILA